MGNTKDLVIERIVRDHPAELAKIREELGDLLRPTGIKNASMLILAVDEALSSIMNYNHEKGFKQDVLLTVSVDDVRFKATLVDPRTEFGLNSSYQSLHGDRKYKISFYLICQVMDEVSYSYRRGFENRLELVKFL
jgi:anti-sigma regulatory factor (Ser/Thr protein kinase)